MRGLRLVALLALLGLLASCGLFSTRIADIKENPRKYAGKVVTVSGEVKDTTNLGFLKYYVVDDGSGTIHVVTSRPLPKAGIKVRARGTVTEELSVGSSSLLVIKEE